MIKLWLSSDNKSGGNVYDKFVEEVLSQKYDTKIIGAYRFSSLKGKTILNCLYKYIIPSLSSKDIDIRDFYSSAYISPLTRANQIFIFHHYDPIGTMNRFVENITFKRFLRNAMSAHVVVVTNLWRDYLYSLGLRNIKVIYNCFKIENYKKYFDRKEFLDKFNLPDKPILYLGQNILAKGIAQSYESLRNIHGDYNIITSGFRSDFKRIINLNLTFEEYSTLLHISEATILFPIMKEGWSRIAHESIICGTPVFCNGSGGMKELCSLLKLDTYRLSDLKDIFRNYDKSEYILQESVEIAKTFSAKKFFTDWDLLIQRIYTGND